jgi:hypothetical protein
MFATTLRDSYRLRRRSFGRRRSAAIALGDAWHFATLTLWMTRRPGQEDE